MEKLKELSIFQRLYTKLLKQILFLIESFLRNISGSLGIKLRRVYYGKRFAKCGKNLRIDEGVIIENPEYIYVGDNVWIDKYCILIAGKVNISKNQLKVKKNPKYLYNERELHIGNNTHIAPQCIIQAHGGVSIGNYFTSSAGAKIYSLSNDVKNCKQGTQYSEKIYYIMFPISIAENVWIGINAIILGGHIEKDSFIAPNSVVITNIKENSFASGNPAKKIKDRFQNYKD